MRKKLLFLFCFLFFTNIANADSVLITGANRGIGLALTELYLKEGYKVFATYLSKQKSTQLLAIKNPNLVTIQVDLASDEYSNIIRNFLREQPIDIIIHNAGFFAYKANQGPMLDNSEWLHSFKINTIAPVKLSWALKENLMLGVQKKIIAISSRRGSNSVNIDDNYKGRYAYRSSKAALNSAMVALAQDFKQNNITVLILHPGRVATKMTNFDGITTAESAHNIKKIIDTINIEQSGLFINADNKQLINW